MNEEAPLCERVPFIQIEITTKCNFECFYCAGRVMPQTHMTWDAFAAILDRLGPAPQQVSLQGEGEPTAHPDFWRMVDELTRRRKRPYTITNCSLIDAERAAASFDTIGVSLDTLDASEAERIGRHKLDRVLERFHALRAAMGAHRILVHTVDYGQDLAPLRESLRRWGVRQRIQPLQPKADYQRRYGEQLPLHGWRYHSHCRYIERPHMRYYDIGGREMPCCFIKDATTFTSTEDLVQTFKAGRVPRSCIGCPQISQPMKLNDNGRQRFVPIGDPRSDATE